MFPTWNISLPVIYLEIQICISHEGNPSGVTKSPHLHFYYTGHLFIIQENKPEKIIDNPDPQTVCPG